MKKVIIEERKNLFVDYNGSYEFYISHGGKQIPQIVIVISTTFITNTLLFCSDSKFQLTATSTSYQNHIQHET